MTDLYHLLKRAKNSDQEAVAEIIERFEPKIKKSSKIADFYYREDLEQELRIEILKLVHRFEDRSIPGFWKFLEDIK